jgi:hypothetical protein
MAFIESHQQVLRHPKTKRLRRLLDISLPTVVGHLHMLWWWALDFAEDGDLSEFDDETIAEECGWEGDAEGFVRALTASGFLDDDRAIHNWDRYTGRLRKTRDDNRKRQQRWRQNNTPVTHEDRDETPSIALVTRDTPLDNPATQPNRTQQNPTGPESPPVVPPADAGRDTAADAAPDQTTAGRTKGSRRTTDRRTKCPETIELTDRHFEYAQQHGFDRARTQEITEAFVGHHRFVGTLADNWYAGWQGWVRRQVRIDKETAERSPPTGVFSGRAKGAVPLGKGDPELLRRFGA